MLCSHIWTDSRKLLSRPHRAATARVVFRSGFNRADTGVMRWGKPLMLPPISWQITSSGQTKKGTAAAGGMDIFFFPPFPLFFWLPVCKELLRTSAEGHVFQKKTSPQTGRTVASPLTCGLCIYCVLNIHVICIFFNHLGKGCSCKMSVQVNSRK